MIAFIDCFIESPVNHCVNSFTERSQIPSTYHIPSKYGTLSLELIQDPACYVILGSAAHVEDFHQWQQELLEFIIPKLEAGIPVLGICYGHQLLCHYFGSTISYIDANKKVLKEARTLKFEHNLWDSKKLAIRLGFAHAQIVTTLGPELKLLAESNKFTNEVVKHKSLPFFGIQAHPEASKHFLEHEAKVMTDQSEILDDGFHFIKSFYQYSKNYCYSKDSII